MDNVDRNTNGKGHSKGVSGGNKEHVIGNGRKGISCYQVAKNLAELCLCSSVLWKVAMELKVWLGFWLIIIKCKKRNDLRMEFLKQNLKIWKRLT